MSDDDLNFDEIVPKADQFKQKWGSSGMQDERDQTAAQEKTKKISLKPLEKRDSPLDVALGYDLYRRKNKLIFLLYLLSLGWFVVGAWQRFQKQKVENKEYWQKNIEDNLEIIKKSLQ